MYHIKEAAQLSAFSIKTLYHYDKIGLLVPLKSEKWLSNLQSGRDLERLQGYPLLQVSRFSLEKNSMSY